MILCTKEAIKSIALVTCLAALSCGCGQQAKKSVSDGFIKDLKTAEIKELIDTKPVLLLDVRTRREYDAGHLHGAKLIPVQELAGRISEIEGHRDKDIVVYCRSGNRSAVAAATLKRKGFKKIYNMLGGISAWEKSGNKTEK